MLAHVVANLAAATPDEESPASTFSEVITTVWDNLGDNGYQTATAVIVATIGIVAMRNAKVNTIAIVVVAIGAFWAGWLGWNTFTGEDNELFPGDISTTKLWDVATASDTGFLVVTIGGAIAALLLWKKGYSIWAKIVIVAGAILGASFLFNLYDAIFNT